MDPHGQPPPTLTRAEVLRAVTKALSRPDLLIRALGEADSDEEAVDALSRALDRSPTAARTVLDQQIRLLTRANLSAMRHELESGLGTHNS